MKKLIKPPRLRPGDKVATVSLSWGGAGDKERLWRYNQGKERLEKVFGLEVVKMPHTLAGTEYVYNHPKERAEDMLHAFLDPSIKAVISCIGGEETIRLLPYIDFDVIQDNPKIFMGYSDTTVNHFMCYKAGLSSFYGPAVLSDFAENIIMPEYTVNWIRKVLFDAQPIGNIEPSDMWTDEYLPWIIDNKNIARTFRKNNSYQLVSGSGIATGHLMGGCFEVLDWLRGTAIFPDFDDFCGAILFLETSEDKPSPKSYEYMLRSFGAIGVLGSINGIVLGKPLGETYFEEYNSALTKVLSEFGRDDMPVLANLSFGHNEPKCILPYGSMAQIDCDDLTFSILESGVV